MKATTSSKSAAAAASSQVTARTNVSSALASTLVQSDKSATASLSAVNADKFASTLRESSSSAAAAARRSEVCGARIGTFAR